MARWPDAEAPDQPQSGPATNIGATEADGYTSGFVPEASDKTLTKPAAEGWSVRGFKRFR